MRLVKLHHQVSMEPIYINPELVAVVGSADDCTLVVLMGGSETYEIYESVDIVVSKLTRDAKLLRLAHRGGEE
jgi:hypothetical protein